MLHHDYSDLINGTDTLPMQRYAASAVLALVHNDKTKHEAIRRGRSLDIKKLGFLSLSIGKGYF